MFSWEFTHIDNTENAIFVFGIDYPDAIKKLKNQLLLVMFIRYQNIRKLL